MVKATLSKDGTITPTCTACGNRKAAVSIAYPKTITLSRLSYVYNGKSHIPSVKVIGRNGKAISAANYSVKYSSGSKNVGLYKVTITFKGNYSGTVTRTFTVVPKGTTIKTPKAAKRAFTVSWSKQSGKMSKARIAGYQIQYSTSSKFSGAKRKSVSGYGKTSNKITGLKSGKKYYVRVRTYMKVFGKTYYSSWSKTKTVRTK